MKLHYLKLFRKKCIPNFKSWHWKAEFCRGRAFFPSPWSFRTTSVFFVVFSYGGQLSFLHPLWVIQKHLVCILWERMLYFSLTGQFIFLEGNAFFLCPFPLSLRLIGHFCQEIWGCVIAIVRLRSGAGEFLFQGAQLSSTICFSPWHPRNNLFLQILLMIYELAIFQQILQCDRIHLLSECGPYIEDAGYLVMLLWKEINPFKSSLSFWGVIQAIPSFFFKPVQ